MFKPNPNYVSSFLQEDELYEPSIELQDYPENNLPDVIVQSDFGDCKVVVSDIYDLFSQQRLENLGPDVVRDYISRNLPSTSPASEAISRMTDDEIIMSIRSRHIQQPSELLTWSKYVSQMISDSIDKSITIDDSGSELSDTPSDSSDTN